MLMATRVRFSHLPALTFLTVGLAQGCTVGAVKSATDVPCDAPQVLLDGAHPRLGEIRAEMLEAIQNGEIPSLSIGVIHQGQLIWKESLGWADRERELPATPRTPYALGSLSKSITAEGLMSLALSKAVALDDPVSRHLDPATIARLQRHRPDDPTLRQLVNMVGGVPHGYVTIAPGGPLSNEDARAIVLENSAFTYAPGKVFEYSNLSYGVLGRAM